MKNQIEWNEYKNAFSPVKDENSLLNEYEGELHKMTVKGGFEKFYLSSAYQKVVKESEIFNETNDDFFNYERKLKIGETN